MKYYTTYSSIITKPEIELLCRHRAKDEGDGLWEGFTWQDDLIFSTKKEAEVYISEHDEPYSNIGVRFLCFPDIRKTQVLVNAENKYLLAEAKYKNLSEIKFCDGYPREFFTCKKCGSKVNTSYYRENSCPICGHDFRSEGLLKKIQAAFTACKESENEYKAELEKWEKKKCEKQPEECWLVKFEFDTRKEAFSKLALAYSA